ncbi:hypothetical protein Y1Q_0004032 [Alligator mississippiensis]|uniref:Uncharacterized protein n=1 Tax=Alligator mississippiensis TaxID=8496 RepID=A0A151PHW8_ALLMI|nr:hypothetical protein Y1Q_0004032 [Alligator mississippiensis]
MPGQRGNLQASQVGNEQLPPPKPPSPTPNLGECRPGDPGPSLWRVEASSCQCMQLRKYGKPSTVPSATNIVL